MRFDVITLFPELFTPFLQTGITRRAFCKQKDQIKPCIEVYLWNPRQFASGAYKRIDDRPFGGGPGMVMLAEPLARCVESIIQQRQLHPPLILFSPAGRPLNHHVADHWGQNTLGAILVCGRYEGIDQRFIDHFVTHQISLGDFVLSGGEIPAMAFLDAIARLQPGVLGSPLSIREESFHPAQGGLLDCPHYTRPKVWRNIPIPEVLLNGNHQEILLWREDKKREFSQKSRPDIMYTSTKESL
jgi:tRNA (guanine37-N1)-methyltransferase